MAYGIPGSPPPELLVPHWIGAEGKPRQPLSLSELGPRHRVLFFRSCRPATRKHR